MVHKDKIVAALKTVFDPEIPVNIYDLGLVYDISIINRPSSVIHIKMTLTSPMCPMAEEIVHMVKVAVSEVSGVSGVDVQLVWDPPWDLSRMSATAKLELDLTEEGW